MDDPENFIDPSLLFVNAYSPIASLAAPLAQLHSTQALEAYRPECRTFYFNTDLDLGHQIQDLSVKEISTRSVSQAVYSFGHSLTHRRIAWSAQASGTNHSRPLA